MQNISIIVERELKPWQIHSAILAVHKVRFEHIIAQSANKIPHD